MVRISGTPGDGTTGGDTTASSRSTDSDDDTDQDSSRRREDEGVSVPEDAPPGTTVREAPDVDTRVAVDQDEVQRGSMGQESRVDLATPGKQQALEREAQTDLLDAAGGVVDTAANNPAKTAAATIASPVPGDELIGGGLAVLIGGGAAAATVANEAPELPIPDNILGGSELPAQENPTRNPELPISNTPTAPEPEINIPESNFQEPEIPVGESRLDQPDIPTRIEAGQQITGRQIGRERQGGQTGIGNRNRGAAEEELEEILNIDETTLGEVEEQQPQRDFVRREFPTGESAVVGRDTPTVSDETGTSITEQVTQPEVSQPLNERFGQSIESGTGRELPPPPVNREQSTTTEDTLTAQSAPSLTRPKPAADIEVANRAATDTQQVVDTATQATTQQLTDQLEQPPELQQSQMFVDEQAVANEFETDPQQRRNQRPRVDIDGDGGDDDRRDELGLTFDSLRFERQIPGGEDFFGVNGGER